MYNDEDDVRSLARSLELKYSFPGRDAIACARAGIERTREGNSPKVFPLDPSRPVARQWADHIALQGGAKPRSME